MSSASSALSALSSVSKSLHEGHSTLAGALSAQPGYLSIGGSSALSVLNSVNSLYEGHSALAGALSAQPGYLSIGGSSALSALSSVNSLYEGHSALAGALSAQPNCLSIRESSALSALSSVSKSLHEGHSALAGALSAQPGYLSIGESSALSALSSVSKSLYEGHSALAGALSAQPSYLSIGESSALSALSSVSKSLYERSVFLGLDVVPEWTRGERTLPSETGSQLEDGVFLQVLGGLNSALPKLWLGAMLASMSTNPDRVRHVATSLRELVMHVVRILAPDHVVMSRQASSTEMVNGRPTRAARLRVIFEAKGQLALTQKEISDFLRHLDDLSGHTHGLGVRLSDAEVKDLISSTMEHLIQLLPGHGKR